MFVCGRGRLLNSFTEVETGKHDQRPQLTAALAACDLTGATLVVAKLDRLSRNVAFLAALQDSAARFVATDIPEANELTIHIMAAVAQAERKAISRRTREALAAAKARGVILGGTRGNAHDLRLGPAASARTRSRLARERSLKVLGQVQTMQAAGITSLRQIAAELDRCAITAPRGGRWSAAQVRRVIAHARTS
jgi:DNA invertase Pin-like site-specific DNA recombinase